MKLNKNHKILIVGLGLLGGSYAQALTKKGYYVTAITRSQSSIDYALSEKMIAKGSSFVDEKLIGEADLVIFALYPHIFIDWIRENQHLFKSGAIITDVTGVKESIVGTIQGMLRSDVEFIAAHPMAGREVYGVQNSDDRIFKGANYVVTPSEKNTPDAIELCRDLGNTLGFAKVSELSPKEHDKIIAFVSQLTHCIAISLMTCQTTENLEDYTGDSFRDLTRIARLNEDMWSELFLINKNALLHQLTLFEGELNRLRCMLEIEDVEGLKDMMRYSTQRRALFDKKI
ncbi:MAG: prephenate dehydrogenase [Ruminococcaceae bacterium]|nr:prephenate dehydrogenase [Oscillospiraceae bacterium]